MARILFVDDEPHIVRLMKRSIERAGYEMVSAADGEEALTLIHEQQPDLLITDIDMPRMTGRQLCRQIQIDFPERKFRIYIITSRTESEHRDWSSTISDLKFVEKPVSMRRLLTELAEYFTDTQ